ncbi:MAG: heme-binding protein [Burkholderiales bacterium]|nr:heme-binding protein [Burkholderiales bacterium]
MKRKMLMIAALGAGIACTIPAAAQKLLANTPSLTTTAAQSAVQAALARCQKDGYTVSVAVVDRAGQPLALLRDNLAGAHTSRTAIGKAATAVSFRTDTTELAASTQAGKPSSGIRALPDVVIVGGGMMIRAKGSLVGGIGVSGAPNGEADDGCAKAGIAAIADAIELE